MNTDKKIFPDPLRKIRELTTSFGIYQFGKGSKPDPSFGYALDDQARALIISHEFKDKALEKTYLQNIIMSQRPDGLLYQFLDKNAVPINNSAPKKTTTAQDAYAETLWAILKTKNENHPQTKKIVENILEYLKGGSFLRPIAYSLLGLTSLKKPHPAEKEFIPILKESFNRNSSPDWPWFENILTYANPLIPWALWEVFASRSDQEAKEIAQKTTDFLIDTCQKKGIPTPIGSNGWYPKGGEKALYDQQPIDVAYMICCLEKAYEITKNKIYLNWAEKWWGWFWGNNIQKVSLVYGDFACRDGLLPSGLNRNEGAESNICFLLAFLSAKRLRITQVFL